MTTVIALGGPFILILWAEIEVFSLGLSLSRRFFELKLGWIGFTLQWDAE